MAQTILAGKEVEEFSPPDSASPSGFDLCSIRVVRVALPRGWPSTQYTPREWPTAKATGVVYQEDPISETNLRMLHNRAILRSRLTAQAYVFHNTRMRLVDGLDALCKTVVLEFLPLRPPYGIAGWALHVWIWLKRSNRRYRDVAV